MKNHDPFGVRGVGADSEEQSLDPPLRLIELEGGKNNEKSI